MEPETPTSAVFVLPLNWKETSIPPQPKQSETPASFFSYVLASNPPIFTRLTATSLTVRRRRRHSPFCCYSRRQATSFNASVSFSVAVFGFEGQNGHFYHPT
ncbi:hypothetical protein L2E82_01210 [Cichorium intybus]|uniref:Uncharacterized protein n=1 Tax=Cichorium intybus TaxID=13427 RepID=A0ACB9H0E7_CICIN|nr:hypothetical protein L2E82_01210 [Cichorium intybus]